MSNQQHEHFLSQIASVRPEKSAYQKRIIDGSSIALTSGDSDVLIEAPTGAGKTCTMAGMAEQITQLDGDAKVLVLTHRRNLFRQMAGNPEALTLKEQAGEITFWGGMIAGSIAEKKLGGIDQDHDVVIGMVETAANLDELDGYTHIFIDEAHHASEESAEREEEGSYASVIARLPNAKIAGFSATTFRGDEGKLHPRLERAQRFIVGVEETQQAGRTVPVKTHVGRARLSNGDTPTELYQKEVENKLDGKSASSVMKQMKDDAYYDKTLEQWDAVTGRTPTIMFVDNVEEIELVQKKVNEKFGPATAVSIFGKQGDEANDAALKDYKSGASNVLIACKMIGEGFDVPKTDNVVSFNSSISRGDMNQFVGRTVRASEGKEFANFIDAGTGTARWGRIEEQHKLQSIRAYAFSDDESQMNTSIVKASPAREGNWHIVPGEQRSIFFRRQADSSFNAIYLDHDVLSTDGRRANSEVDRGRKLNRLTDRNGLSAFSVAEMAAVVGEHVQKEAGFIARNAGLRGAGYVSAGENLLTKWSGAAEAFAGADVVDDKGKLREAAVRRHVRGDGGAQVGFKALSTALSKQTKHQAVYREGLRLTATALDEAAKTGQLSPSLSKQVHKATRSVISQGTKKMNDKDVDQHYMMIKFGVDAAKHEGLNKNTTGAFDQLIKTTDLAQKQYKNKESERDD